VNKLIAVAVILLSSICTYAQERVIDPNNLYPQVKLETNMGSIIVELDRVRAPITATNFLRYVVEGEYNNTVFHRVMKDFVVQGGGYTAEFKEKKVYESIFNESGNGLKNESGTIAMARESDPHSANRQFFFNVKDNSILDPGRRWGYAVFGSIVEGEEVLEKISLVETDFNDDMMWDDVPKEPVLLIKATLLTAQ
jgi:peptidyl-prolyl cis-trans isomerase A (cyclophilin A)